MRNQYVQNKFPKISRISWGAIFAGALAAITVSFLLNMLGLGIGLTTIDPLTETNPLDGLGTGTIIWWGVSNLAALFMGGMVAGRMSGLPANSEGGASRFLGVVLIFNSLPVFGNFYYWRHFQRNSERRELCFFRFQGNEHGASLK